VTGRPQADRSLYNSIHTPFYLQGGHLMVAEVKTPASVLTPEYKKTRPGAMFAFAVGTMSDSMEGGLINTLFPVIAKALELDIGALGTLSSISRFARMIFGTLHAVAHRAHGEGKHGPRTRLLVLRGED
jgi:hypothetical protein